MHWLMFLLGVVCGWIVLSVVGVPALACILAALHRNAEVDLRVALGDLVRAVEQSGGDRGAVDAAVGRARKVL